jgi:hypothetical protein
VVDESRRQHRIGVALDVRIRGKDRHGQPFEEMTHSDDVSRGGCSFHTTHELAVGAEVEIEIFRHVPGSAPFATKGMVLRVTAAEPRQFSVGVRFTGPQFPTYSSEITSI